MELKSIINEKMYTEGCPLYIYDGGLVTRQKLENRTPIGVIWGTSQTALRESFNELGTLLKKDALYNEPMKIQVGWYAFTGGNFSPNPDDCQNVLGVVCWVNPDANAPFGQRGLIIMPEEIELPWSDGTCMAEASSLTDGWENTQHILKLKTRSSLRFPATEYCATYTKVGIPKGSCFLPAKDQWVQILANRHILDRALLRIGGKGLSTWYWSSTELDYACAHEVSSCGTAVSGSWKYQRYAVRAVVAF